MRWVEEQQAEMMGQGGERDTWKIAEWPLIIQLEEAESAWVARGWCSDAADLDDVCAGGGAAGRPQRKPGDMEASSR